MLALPVAAEPLIVSLSVAFTEPTFKRIVPLLVGAILTRGRRTVTAVLRTMRTLAGGHWSDYHRVFSRAAWTLWLPGMLLARAILVWADPDEPVAARLDQGVAGLRQKPLRISLPGDQPVDFTDGAQQKV